MEQLRGISTEWVLLIANLLLVAVTAWYARLTLRLAKSGDRAAKAAELSAIAAEAAADSSRQAVVLQRLALDSQNAQSKVSFKARPRFSRRGHLIGLRLSINGGSPTIHRVELAHAVPTIILKSGATQDLAMRLEGEGSWPHTYTRNTRMLLRFAESPKRSRGAGLIHIGVNIWYSLDGTTELVARAAATDLLASMFHRWPVEHIDSVTVSVGV